MLRNFIGELLGTFVLVSIGLFSVFGAVIEGWFNLYVVASIWVLGVFLGIIVSRKLSPAHLNPAVTFGFIVAGEKLTFSEVVVLIFGQMFGAFLAGILIYIIFSSSIVEFELLNEIVRSTQNGKQTAMIFGEFYPNPTTDNSVSTMKAAILEGIGTFGLMAAIFLVIHKVKSKNFIAFLIALTVGILIVFIAPYTQAGFNPARDFMPRIVSSLFGWENIVWSENGFDPLTVYVLAPIMGASLAGFIKRLISVRKERS